MLRKTVIVGLAAAGIVAGSALASTAALAAGHGGGGGNWPQEGAWNWPEYAGGGPTCNWTQVKYYSHGHAHWRWEHAC
jgi:hypothetical protein